MLSPRDPTRMLSPILAKLTSLVQKRRREERRQVKRMSPQHLVSCQIKLPGHPNDLPARVDNLSIRGIGILTTEATVPCSTIQVVLINAPHTFALTVDVEVMHCSSVVNGDYFLGCRFTRSLTYEEMAPFFV
jgi:hypothetical protein